GPDQDALRPYPGVSLGAHLNILRGEPLSPVREIPSLVDGRGRFLGSWARLEDGHASFRALGREICYLPMLHVDGRDLAAGAPFVIDRDGGVHPLAATAPATLALEAGVTKPDIVDPDTGVLKARTVVKPGAAYELFVWKDGGWKSLGRREANEETREFAQIRGDGLHWLVEDGSERLERIFTIEDGRQVFW
ncbi:MAG: hypothetical protein ACKO0W_04255, partial [Planctomycetota bacterium]